MTSLGPKEQQALEVIVEFVAANSYAPTVRDVQHGLELGSPATAHRLLQKLRDKGLITWEPHRSRSIRVYEKSFKPDLEPKQGGPST